MGFRVRPDPTRPVRESAFDELHRAFQTYRRRWRKQQMDVIGHDHELVERKAPRRPVVGEGLKAVFPFHLGSHA
jgi:hypothetical protein